MGMDIDRLRGKMFGFVFQNHCLLTEMTTLENVMMPWRVVGGETFHRAERRARNLLAAVGLEDKINAEPQNLSGGEKQRVAVARALMLRPPFLLADEPTGNLDAAAEARVVDLLAGLCGECATGLLVATHGSAFDRYGSRDLVLGLGGVKFVEKPTSGHLPQICTQRLT
jgi:predicted ABC-type transport system involved in lysophospholipase L1 biosynthesis ATPase subunit